ncbi:hypothetical protein MIND_00223100 [Mycena indigotica]|uniref:Uncharacterized protein n=1 Tax=Mycena indigotica TaxID=2126181 RepID=A0A8H6WEQ6_9AGAR|nr:uncharacterized protein MIND_00223100 [Mycena indigotica]KAF7312108.1 hypothetical protein MIND_00223100 [Mycena indigotica]
MSYADAASKHLPPNQPRADPALLNTSPPTASPGIDPTKKINLVPPSDPVGRRKHTRLDETREEGLYIWESAKHYLLRPGIAGGLIGIVNLGLLGGAARAFYVNPNYRRDTTVISSVVATSFAVLFAEGFAADAYRKTPAGQEEERRAREEGAVIYRHAKEQILRPGTLGGIVGVLNVAALGTIGWFAYDNWDRTWDRRIISAISAGLAALSLGEGLLAEKYRVQKN